MNTLFYSLSGCHKDVEPPAVNKVVICQVQQILARKISSFLLAILEQ